MKLTLGTAAHRVLLRILIHKCEDSRNGGDLERDLISCCLVQPATTGLVRIHKCEDSGNGGGSVLGTDVLEESGERGGLPVAIYRDFVCCVFYRRSCLAAPDTKNKFSAHSIYYYIIFTGATALPHLKK